ncbi:MAG: riboflavin synthase subunit alpha [Bacteroidia bacterium]|nr:MAG: riboflavin synthase subunit alpha [Bacteroidia bacterium]
MFTGIIESMSIVREIRYDQSNMILTLENHLAKEFYIDQSIAHNGACLTVTDVQPPFYQVTLIEETLNKTNFRNIRIGDKINIERSMLANSRLDGHFVTGHVDCVGNVKSITDKNGSKEIWVEHPESPYFITIPKGSIGVNGVSLTVVESKESAFSVHIIPYTWEHTNLQNLNVNDWVNLEFDILGKYIQKIISKSK